MWIFDWITKVLKANKIIEDKIPRYTYIPQTGCFICSRLEKSTSRQALASLARHQAGSKCTREVVNE